MVLKPLPNISNIGVNMFYSRDFDVTPSSFSVNEVAFLATLYIFSGTQASAVS